MTILNKHVNLILVYELLIQLHFPLTSLWNCKAVLGWFPRRQIIHFLVQSIGRKKKKKKIIGQRKKKKETSEVVFVSPENPW